MGLRPRARGLSLPYLLKIFKIEKPAYLIFSFSTMICLVHDLSIAFKGYFLLCLVCVGHTKHASSNLEEMTVSSAHKLISDFQR